MKNAMEARALVRDLGGATWQLAVLAAAVEAGLVGALATPQTTAALAAKSGLGADVVDALLGVLAAMGLVARGEAWSLSADAAPFLTSETLLHDLRATRLQSRHVIDGARARSLAPGWSFTDAETLESQGKAGGGGMDMMVKQLVGTLDGLAPAFDAGGRFLDVGTGVGAIAIEFCRWYPKLRAVGLEPMEAPFALARRNVREAGVADRVELRQIFVQALADRDTFDLAWIPQPFLPPDVYPVALRTVLGSLKPGGWLLTIVFEDQGAELPVAMARLRSLLWGGTLIGVDRALKAIGAAGYTDVRPVPLPPGMPIRPIVARRPA